MVGDKALLGSFSSMMNHLHSKMCSLIGHVEVPKDLMKVPQHTTKRQKEPESQQKTNPSGTDKMQKPGNGAKSKDMFTNKNGDHWSIGSFM